ncbi:hypothetical protein FSP39_016320 [Pinctada imbricata]|uniref:CFA20 domain-containing protein n=1 Tax=Pinctada imbricata TaxID=66713 RepID=A0AA89CAZ6_PINIB|nr:hypothetical protein FSP39_016320 [Pinctada imbricata]
MFKVRRKMRLTYVRSTGRSHKSRFSGKYKLVVDYKTFNAWNQGGPYFEVFTPQGKDSTASWKLNGSVKKVYDKEVKGNVCSLEGSSATTKMQLPKDRQSLTLIQRYLIFQIFIPRGQEFSFELGVTDLSNNKRRILLSTSQKESHVTPLHAKVPLTILRRHVWLNLCLDLVSLVSDLWRGQTFKATESITISANCKLRRVFTMKSQPPDTAGDEEMHGCPSSNVGELDQIPKQCQFATDVSFVTQLINVTKIKHVERFKGGGETHRPVSNMEVDLNASGRRTSLNDSNYHIAFGTKVPGVPNQSKSKGNVTNRSLRSNMSRADEGDSTYRDLSASVSSKDGFLGDQAGGANHLEAVGHHPAHQRQLSDPASVMDTDMQSRFEIDRSDVPMAIVQPHPPREPSSDRLRRKIRVKNGGTNSGSVSSKERVSSAGSLKDEGLGSVSQSTSAKSSKSGSQSSLPSGKDLRKKRIVSEGELLSNNHSLSLRTDPHNAISKGGDSGVVSLSESVSGMGLSDSLNYRKEYNREDYQGDGAVFDDSVSDVIDVLKHGIVLHEDLSSGDEREDYEESEEEPEKDDVMYLFSSKPKKAPRRHISPNFLEMDETESQMVRSPNTSRGAKSQRGAKFENDFHSSDSSSQEDEDIRRKKLPGSRPQSGTSSRPHSGSTSRPHSGNTSRPHSGSTSRPHSGTASKPHSASSRDAASPKGQRHSVVSKSHRKDKHSDGQNFNQVPKFMNVSPELRISTQLPTHRSEVSVNGNSTNRSVSRMNRKSLREIPQDDLRLSVVKSAEKPYNPQAYQMADITESFEAQMFASMKRSAEDAMEDVSIKSPTRVNPPPVVSPRKTPRSTHPGEGTSAHRHIYDFSPTLTSDDDTSLSTWKAPPNQHHNYENEMKPSRMSTDTLTSSNPRDWSGVFSPPIVFPGERADSTEDLSISSSSPRKDTSSSGSSSPRKVYAPTSLDPGTDEEELDLLYDSCLNCYYDPKTFKYYELIV